MPKWFHLQNNTIGFHPQMGKLKMTDHLSLTKAGRRKGGVDLMEGSVKLIETLRN